MTSGVPEAFGFVPAHVVADLQDIGNWKSRATAIDVLHKCLKDVARPAVLVPSLPDFIQFLLGLVADPNFKIATSSMSILGDLAAKVGSELEPYLRVIVPALLDKFSDSKILVRTETIKVTRRLMHTCTPNAVLTLMAAGGTHPNWRVREEVLNSHIMALLSFSRSSYDPPSIYRLLSSCLSDSKERVRLVALEGLAVLSSKLGAGEMAGWMTAGRGASGALPEALRGQVTTRLSNSALPGVNGDGLIQHVVELPGNDSNPDMRLSEAAAMGPMPGSRPTLFADTVAPVRSRFRNPDTLAPPADGGRGPHPPGVTGLDGARLGPEPLSLGQPGSRRVSSMQHDGPRALALGPGAVGQHHQQQSEDVVGVPLPRPLGMQPVRTAPTPNRFSAAHEPLSNGAHTIAAAVPGGAAPSTSGWASLGSGGPPPSGHQHGQLGVRPHIPERPVSPHREAAAGGHHVHPVLQPLHGAEGGQERGPGGGPPAHGPALQPLKHHWGASRSLEHQTAPLGKSPGDCGDDCPLSPTRGYQTLLHNRNSGPAGMTGSGDGGRDSLDLLTRPASVRTQAAAELRDGRTSSAQPYSHPPAPGSGSSSSTGLWLQSSLEQEAAVTRQETFSPSKAESIARLKNRRIEMRAATAQQSQETSFSSASDLSVSQNEVQSFPVPNTSGPNTRRLLNSQLSDHHRGDRERPEVPSRGYNSVASTPTRAQGPGGGGGVGGPFDDTPPSSQSHRPPRGVPAARLGRGGDAGGSGPTLSVATGGGTRSPTLSEATPSTPGGTALSSATAVPVTPIANMAPGPYWEKGRSGDVQFEELGPMADPERAIRSVITRLVEANHADRKELDWQGQFEALVDARRLVKHHADCVRAVLHEFVRAAAPAIDQLRSQTSKCALTLFQECFSLLGRAMDRELDEIVPVLIKKAGEVSNAGRDTFLAAEADRTLAEMYRCCGEARSITALLSCAGHKNPYVRGKVAYHLDSLLECCGTGGGVGGAGGRQAMSNNMACMERVFKTAAGFLDEGSLDSRTHGKRIIWHVKGMLANRGEFERLVSGVSPESLHRKVVDVVEGLNGPPPPPSRGVAGGVGGAQGSRLASRQLGGGGVAASPARGVLEQVVGGSLTQPPPPVRQGSYSAPSPVHLGIATPERRRMGRQRTNDLDGIPEAAGVGGGAGLSRTNSGTINGRISRVSSGTAAVGMGFGLGPTAGGSAPSGGRTRHAASADGGSGTSGFNPAVQETVVKALQLLSAKDFRERMEALHSVEAIVPGLCGAPESLLMQLLDAIVARLGDANSKVSMLALELVASLTGTLRQRMALGLNTLVPALAAALGSSNDKIRNVAISATDALVSSLDPAMLVQHFGHCVANGTQRGKLLLAEKLVQIVNALYGSKPQLVARYAVPAAFSLLKDGRGGEVKTAANALLGALARLMGSALLEQAGSLNAVAHQRVAEAVTAVTGQLVKLDGERTPRAGSLPR